VIDAARQRYPAIVAIVITGYGTVRDAVETIKKARRTSSPALHFDELMHVIQTSIERGRLRSENAYLRSQLEAVSVPRASSAQPGDAAALLDARDRGAHGEHRPRHRRTGTERK
jgi:DNA-binding NtrC family response regulator